MAIKKFREFYWFLSNFYPVEVKAYGLVGATAEHVFQAIKSPDPDEQEWVIDADDAWEAKRRGRQVRLRDNWEEKRVDYMYDIVKAKFEQNLDIQVRLLGTYTQELVEGNNWGDTFWGKHHGTGENHLGKILMRVRRELYEE